MCEVAVTGAAGYIGSRVLARIQAHHSDWDITAIDNFHAPQVQGVGDVQIDQIDVSESESLFDALDGADAVLHLAAISGVDECEDKPDLAYRANVQGTNNVAYWCWKTETPLAFPVSMAVLGNPQNFPIMGDSQRNPLNWYGKTKVLGERAISTLAEGRFPAHLFMLSNLYGTHKVDGTTVSKGTVINYFIERAKADESLTVYAPGWQSRNYIHVDDVARLMMRSLDTLMETDSVGETRYAVGTYEDLGVRELAQTVQSAAEKWLDSYPDIETVDNPRVGQEAMTRSFIVNSQQARDDLEWEPEHTIAGEIRSQLR